MQASLREQKMAPGAESRSARRARPSVSSSPARVDDGDSSEDESLPRGISLVRATEE